MAFGLDIALQPAPALAWRTLADSVGGTFEPGDFWSPDRLVLFSAPWTLTLSQTAVAAPLTVVSAGVFLRHPLRLRLLRGEFLRPGAGIDLAPLALGGPAFHSTSRLTASDPARAHQIFSSPALRRQLVAEPHLALDLSSGALRLALSGHIDEKDRLVRLLATAAELLQRLSDLGIASPP